MRQEEANPSFERNFVVSTTSGINTNKDTTTTHKLKSSVTVPSERAIIATTEVQVSTPWYQYNTIIVEQEPPTAPFFLLVVKILLLIVVL